MQDYEIKELWNIRTFLEGKYYNYPDYSDCSNQSLHHCREGADLIKRVLGYPIRIGSFNIHPTKTPGLLATDIIECFFPHAWNINPLEKAIVDVCADQFPQVKDKVLIIPVNSKLAERYVPEWYTYLQFTWERRKNPLYINNYNDYQAFSQLKQAKETKVFA